MSRSRYPKHSGQLPPPLPPESRTVGQLVAESIAAYRRAPGLALRVGALAAVPNIIATQFDDRLGRVGVVCVGAIFLSAALVLATALVHRATLGRSAVVALAAGVIVAVPYLALERFFSLAGLAWIALVALAVPAALLERLSLPAALARAFALARADYVHVLGGIATLVLLVLLTRGAAFFLLREVADNTVQVSAFLASLVVAPLLFLGIALLYDDQVARIGLTREQRRELRRSRGAPSA